MYNKCGNMHGATLKIMNYISANWLKLFIGTGVLSIININNNNNNYNININRRMLQISNICVKHKLQFISSTRCATVI